MEARAGSLQVAPVSLDFTAQQQAQGLWLSNTGTEAINVQIRPFKWSQADGENQLAPTDELVASTAILSIAPGDSQLVRLIRLDSSPPAGELSYRVLVDELPTLSGNHDGLQFLLRYSLPVFVLPPGAIPRFSAQAPQEPTDLSQISVQMETRDNQSWLIMHNHGPQRVRLSRLSLTDTSGQRRMLIDGLVGYVLAGQSRRWALPANADALREGTLKAKFNDDQEEQPLPMDNSGH